MIRRVDHLSFFDVARVGAATLNNVGTITQCRQNSGGALNIYFLSTTNPDLSWTETSCGNMIQNLDKSQIQIAKC